jgi:hypothetical protein
MSLGVALIGLGGVNLVFLRVSPKFITTFPMLPDPIPYSESESLSLLWRFRFLVSFFLRTFSSLSNFSLNCARDCFVGLGIFPPFLAARKLDFPFRLSQNNGNRKYCALCTRPHASCTGRSVSRYVPFSGLWDFQYQVTSYPSSCCAKVSRCEKGWICRILPGHIRARSPCETEEASTCPLKYHLSREGCTDPVTRRDTFGERDSTDQPWRRARSWKSCWPSRLSCSTSRAVARCRN